MEIRWEALSAVASVLSSFAVVAALVVAGRQVRVGAQQVEHLRRATQLEGTMQIFEKLADPDLQEALRFIRYDLPQKVRDPVYWAELRLLTMAPHPHPEMRALRLMEMVGTYVKHGLLEGEIIFDYWIPVIVNTWEPLVQLGVIREHRIGAGSALWENVEDLYQRAMLWLETRSPDAIVHPTPAVDDDRRPAGTKS